MQLSKEEYARKRIHNGSSVQSENSVTQLTVQHHSASLVMPNSYPRDGIFNQYLTIIKDSYNNLHTWRKFPSDWPFICSVRCIYEPRSDLIRVFAMRSMGSQGSKLSSCGQRRLWSYAEKGCAFLLLLFFFTFIVRNPFWHSATINVLHSVRPDNVPKELLDYFLIDWMFCWAVCWYAFH